MKEKSKEAWPLFSYLLLIFAASLILVLGLLVWILPHQSFSVWEKRVLTVWDAPSAKELADGSFGEEISSLYTDQFPMREGFFALKANVERLLGKQENNGILFGEEDYLIPRCRYDSMDVAEKNLTACESFAVYAEQNGLSTTLLVAPRSVDVMTGSLPSIYDGEEQALLLQRIGQTTLHTVFPIDELQKKADDGVYVQYRTDHHWTVKGAYIAYETYVRSLGITPMSEELFEIETADAEFFGTSYAKAGGVAARADAVERLRYEGDTEYTVCRPETGKAWQGFYTEDEGYDSFLGGNYARLTIRKNGEENRPKLLVIKDSYANSLVPFLAIHFDLDLVDLRYEKGSIASLLEQGDYDGILIVQGVDTLATDPSLARIGALS